MKRKIEKNVKKCEIEIEGGRRIYLSRGMLVEGSCEISPIRSVCLFMVMRIYVAIIIIFYTITRLFRIHKKRVEQIYDWCERMHNYIMLGIIGCKELRIIVMYKILGAYIATYL